MWSLPPSAGGMSTPKNKVIRQMLLSLTDGFAAFEEVRKIPGEGELKGKITLKKLAYRDPRTVKFKVDKQGGFNGFQQVTSDMDGQPLNVYIKPEKAFVITQHDELNPHYGVSFFESAYPHFDAKRKLYYIAHLAAQFAAVPGRVGKIPHGAKANDVAAFRNALVNFAFNGAMVIPPDYEVDAFNGNSNFDFLKLIDHHNHMMSKSILAPFFDQENHTVLIESNGGQNSDADLFLQFMVSIADSVAENMTHYLMPRYIDWNFGSKKYPVFKPGQLSDTARKAIKELFSTLVVASVLNSTPEMVRELEKKVSADLGLDIDYDEIEKKEQEAAEAKAQADEDAAKAEAEALSAGAAGGVGADGQPIGGAAPSGGPPAPGGAPPMPSQTAQLSNGIDDLVQAANNLFLARPDDTEEATPIDDVI
jgi:hypothetical protein